jgi:hypothetical protein
VFRLSTPEEEGATVLTVDGQLAREYINFVEESCNSAATKGKRVQLHLRDISAIDDAGRSLLHRLAHKGVEIRASGIYTSYVVRGLDANSDTMRSK